jgi:hypothetical protein
MTIFSFSRKLISLPGDEPVTLIFIMDEPSLKAFTLNLLLKLPAIWSGLRNLKKNLLPDSQTEFAFFLNLNEKYGVETFSPHSTVFENSTGPAYPERLSFLKIYKLFCSLFNSIVTLLFSSHEI